MQETAGSLLSVKPGLHSRPSGMAEKLHTCAGRLSAHSVSGAPEKLDFKLCSTRLQLPVTHRRPWPP